MQIHVRAVHRSSMGTNGRSIIVIVFVSSLLIGASCSYSFGDTVQQGQKIRDWEYLISANGNFKLAFFNPGKGRNRYLGIWYHNRPDIKPVWVGNRDTPVDGSSGALIIDEFGKLKIKHKKGDPIEISSTEARGNTTACATLLDSGNFVLKELNHDGSTKQIIWQSFDYPTDTLLPGMKLGMNFKTGQTWSLTSWVSDEVPATGSFTLSGDAYGTSQLIIWWQKNMYWVSGEWKNGHFEHAYELSDSDYANCTYVINEDEKYLTCTTNRSDTFWRYVMDSTGAISSGASPALDGGCLYDSAPGCAKMLPECRNQYTRFESSTGYISDDSYKIERSDRLSEFDCKTLCFKDCSCAGYALTNDNRTGCQFWSKEMRFVEDLFGGREVNILHHEEQEIIEYKHWWKLLIVISGISISMYMSRLVLAKKEPKVVVDGDDDHEKLLGELLSQEFGEINEQRRNELQLFSFESIQTATNNFASENLLGQGGFGLVFKGILNDGLEVAIKRAKCSGQGLIEFKNEIILIAKLQHTNLVRLLGCCLQREEKILVYEYLPNKSLDYFLFEPEQRMTLDWEKRFNIIEGVAQGLLYLHKYSRLKIVHRDLKSSNILLDENMNPKISDFGTARIFAPNDTEANASRIAGTYGYMAPEYAMDGIFSAKSDVYSFGVLLLEIVSGKRNTAHTYGRRQLNLIAYAWELWNEGRVLELIDSALGEMYNVNEALSCTHVGLLCVQDNPIDRPTMSEAMTMIRNESFPLSTPRQPALFAGWNQLEINIPSSV
ncbi:Bulb-type lectin domain [Dillenia turbinata]|uniref:Receptor-like serine/threonine-protein kinase n=1 Tax=Dillenia turbinata TaxID=194707 RepID=A0AAN8UHY8_9MAGN